MLISLIIFALFTRVQSEPANGTEACVHGFAIDDRCVCDWGWTGPLCSEDINECLHSPCSSGSTCLNTNGSYECLCPAGRTGPLCEAGSCGRDAECLHGGFCEDGECICQPEFDGPNCERKYEDPCLSMDGFRGSNGTRGSTTDGSPRCKEYEVCLRNRTEMRGFSCVCRPGFGGRFCDVPIDSYHGPTATVPYSDYAAEKKMHTMTDVTITVLVRPEFFVVKVDDFLLSLSQRLKTTVKIRKTEGEMDVFEWNSIDGQGPRVQFGSRNDARAEYSTRKKRSVEEMMSGVLVVLQIDLEECSKRCFTDATAVARYIAAMEAKEPLNPAMPIYVPLIAKEEDADSPVLIIIVIVLLLAAFIALGVLIAAGNRRDKLIAPIWKVPTAKEAMEREEAEKAARQMKDGRLLQFSDSASAQNLSPSTEPVAIVTQPAPAIRPPLTPLEVAAIGSDSISLEMQPLACKLDSEKRTSLHLLALNSKKKSADLLSDCNLLIEFGMDVNAQDYYGNTALHYACRNARSSFVQRLLEAGADPSIRNELYMTALHEAAQHFDELSMESILAHPAYRDKSNLNDVDRKDRSPLKLYAAYCTHSIRGAELLLKAGADANYTGDRNATYRMGRTALHHAAQFNSINRRMIEFLIDNNANKDATDDDGATPLWLAVSANNMMAVDELLKHGASIDLADNNDQTPEELAIARGYTAISERFKMARLTRNISARQRIIKMPRSTESQTSSVSTTPSPPGFTASGPSSNEGEHSRQSVYSIGSASNTGSTLRHTQQLQPSPPYDNYDSYPFGHNLQTGCALNTYQQFATYNPPACAYQKQ